MIRLFIIILFLLCSCDPKPVAQPTGDNTTVTADTLLNIRK